MKPFRLVTIFVWLLAASTTATAQERLTLLDATTQALAKNHRIRMEREEVTAADARMESARGSYDPTFHFDAGTGYARHPVTSLFSGAPEGDLAPSWGYFSGNGGSWYQWYDNEKDIEKNGGTVVKSNGPPGAFTYETTDGRWIRLDLSKNSWQAFSHSEDAWNGFESDRSESNSGLGQAVELTLNITGGNIAARLGKFALGRIFSSEITTLGLSGGADAVQSGTGLTTEGMAYELKFLPRHLPGTAQAEGLVAREGAAHVFNDLSTLSRVEADLFTHGVSTGTVRGFSRVGLQFEESIGFRIGQDGTRQALNYAEMKIRANGLYHIIPRTGPSH